MKPLGIAALANARKPCFSAFFFSGVRTSTGNSAEKHKQTAAENLGRMGYIALPQGIAYGPTTERNRERTTMALVGQVNDDADRFLRMATNGRLLSGSVVIQPAGNTGAIPLRGGAMHATIKLLPFQGEMRTRSSRSSRPSSW